MKTGFSPVAMLDAERAPGSSVEDGAGSEQQSGSAAFDSVLAMVASQVAALGTANKPAAPVVVLPVSALAPEGALRQPTQGTGDPAKDLTRPTANTTADRGLYFDDARAVQLSGVGDGPTDVLPGVPFHQLVATQAGQLQAKPAPVAEPTASVVQSSVQEPEPGAHEAPVLTAPVAVEQGVPVASQPLVGVAEKPALSAAKPAANQARAEPQSAPQPALALPLAVSGEPAASETRPRDERRLEERSAPQVVVQEQSAQPDARLLAQANASLASAVQVATPGAANNNVASAASTAVSKQSGATDGRSRPAALQGSELSSEVDTTLPTFSLPGSAAQGLEASPALNAHTLRTAPQEQAAQPAQQPTAQPAPSVEPLAQPGVAAVAVRPKLPQSVDLQPSVSTQAAPAARVEAPLPVAANVQVEFVELPVEGPGNENSVGELSPRELADELDTASERREPGADAEREGEAQQSASEQRNPQPQRPFQSSEVQGARGLEQVVASLLRANGAGVPEAANQRSAVAVSARGAAKSNSAQPVLTQKSGNEKSAQLSGNASQALLEAAQRREEELAQRELGVEEPAALPLQHEAKAAPEPSAAEPAPAAALPTPATVADPDAALMGKLARGEGINAANISIDHPELGAMDLLVQSENGRVEVRATAETPKAAAVLRAHESALRYGIQQAGMTFGALKVRSRGGEGPVSKTREAVKQRRRNHEWEA